MAEISKEYAAALFELAREQQSEEEIYSSLKGILSEFTAQPEYVQLLSSPDIPFSARRDMLEQAFGGKVPEYVLSFTELLCEHGHIESFSDCVNEYKLLYRAFRSVSSARIVSAVELTEEEKTAVIQKLEKLSGHRVKAQYRIDPSLIGGMVIHIDDKIIDGSIRTKIKEVKEVISK